MFIILVVVLIVLAALASAGFVVARIPDDEKILMGIQA